MSGFDVPVGHPSDWLLFPGQAEALQLYPKGCVEFRLVEGTGNDWRRERNRRKRERRARKGKR